MANPTEVYEAWLDALNRRDWGLLEELMDPGAQFTFTHLLPSGDALLRGRETIMSSFLGLRVREPHRKDAPDSPRHR